MSRRVSPEHVIWAYDELIFDMAAEGLSAEAIRTRLREESGLHVGAAAIRDVLRTMPKNWRVRFPSAGGEEEPNG